MKTSEQEVQRLYQLCITQAEQSRSQPRLLEALWDGDAQGWRLDLYLTTEDEEHERQRRYVTTLSYGTDIRLFEGTVPPWPESVVATALGQRLERSHGCTFWFPSPDHPDDRCPAYTEREQATSCADCSKLFIPDDSPYVSKEVCYRCSTARTRRARPDKGRVIETSEEGG